MKPDESMSNIPQMNVATCTKQLSTLYSMAIKKGYPLKTIPSVMLWGPPGIGKSQGVREIGEAIQEKTGKEVHITDVRLLLFNPIDLRGIPTANEDKTLAVWLKPKIFQMDESPNVVNILFLDEISAAPQSVQAAAYQITLDRTVGEHRLPDNCIVMAAGNRVTDKSVAYKMPKALSNRLLHIEIRADVDAWCDWAVDTGIHPKVIGFIRFRRSFLLNFDAQSEDLAYATPRSWEMVSNLLKVTGGTITGLFDLISGLVGLGVAIEFRTWEKVWDGLPKIEDIFDGKNPKAPTNPDALYALASSITSYAKEHSGDMRRIANSIAYADKLPADFSLLIFKDYIHLQPGFREKLMNLPEFNRWMQSKGKYLNGTNY